MDASQLSPHRAERTPLPSRHGPLAALVAVPARARATVLMIPGYTGSKEDFAPLLDPVAGAGLAVVAIDLPGQYESPGPADEASYLPSELGTVVAKLVPRLAPQPVILLGHSYGGLVCRGAVLAGASIAGMVLMCSGPAALPDGPRRRLLELAEPVMRTHGVRAAHELRQAAEANAGVPARPPGLAALLRQRFLASTPAGLLGMATGLRTEPDLVAELATVLLDTATPCLVTCGEHDDAWPPDVQRELAARLGAPFAAIPGAAHSPNVENPRALLELLLPTWHSWLGAGQRS
jgi:pimeloyl-ACP methyl ester carboxylesterase